MLVDVRGKAMVCEQPAVLVYKQSDDLRQLIIRLSCICHTA